MATAEEIIEELGGKGSRAACPSCGCERDALSVDTSASSKVVVHCFHGCPQESVLAALRNLGLWGPPNRAARNSRAINKLVMWAHTIVALADSDESAGIQITQSQDRASLAKARKLVALYPVPPSLIFPARSIGRSEQLPAHRLSALVAEEARRGGAELC